MCNRPFCCGGNGRSKFDERIFPDRTRISTSATRPARCRCPRFPSPRSRQPGAVERRGERIRLPGRAALPLIDSMAERLRSFGRPSD